MPGTVRLGQTLTKDFITRSIMGAVVDSDTTPTCAIYEDTTTTAILTPTCIKRGTNTGDYYFQAAVTTANGFEIGKSYNLYVTAIVGGITDSAIVDTFVVEDIRRPLGAVVSDAGNSTSVFKTDLGESTNDYWKDALVMFTTGNLIYQVKKIGAYNGTTKIITLASGLVFTSIPSVSDNFVLIAY